ncbi:MAG TPA: TetR/AcrR family transcriptional regulator [Steroidobacteraceae bacterium]|jgi:AcrR family transcriptional regulator
MSSEVESLGARAPKRARGKQRVAELLEAAADVFAERGFEAATMTEIAARADAPIGSLYQFFPSKEALADTLLENYARLIADDLQELERRAAGIEIDALVEILFKLLRSRPRERAAALPLAAARMDEGTRRSTFRHMMRRHIAAILRARQPSLTADAARDMSIVLLQLVKAVSSLTDEEGLAGRQTALREMKSLAVHYLRISLSASSR